MEESEKDSAKVTLVDERFQPQSEEGTRERRQNL